MKFPIYPEKVQVTVNWSATITTHEVDANGTTITKTRQCDFTDLCDITAQFPGKEGTYTVEAEMTHLWLLDGKFGWKWQGEAVNLMPTGGVKENPLLADLREREQEAQAKVLAAAAQAQAAQSVNLNGKRGCSDSPVVSSPKRQQRESEASSQSSQDSQEIEVQ